MAGPTTSNVTSVPAAVSDTILLAANSIRVGFAVTNDSSALMYLKLGAAASPTSYTVILEAGDYYEDPTGWTGTVHGYWTVATGNARVTEISP